MAARDNRREANRKALQRNPIGKAFPFKPLTGSCRTGHVVAALPSLLSVCVGLCTGQNESNHGFLASHLQKIAAVT
jgi:hypothetical protein